MASTINASTSGGLITTADTSGLLQLQAAGNTGITLNSSGAIGVGTSPSYGTAGQVLLSNGSAAAPAYGAIIGSGGATASGNVTLTAASAGSQVITTTNYNQSLTLPDATTVTKSAVVFHVSNIGPYPLRVKDNAGNVYGFLYPEEDTIIGLSDNSTAAGVWNTSLQPIANIAVAKLPSTLTGTMNVSSAVSLDSTRTLYVIGGQSSATVYAFVYDSSTNTIGTVVTVDTSSTYPSAYAISSSSVLVAYNKSSLVTAVVLSVSGTTITVNTPVAAAAGAMTGYTTGHAGYSQWIACGSTYILRYVATSVPQLRAFTVSGTVPSVGTAITTTGTNAACTTYALSPTAFAVFFSTATSIVVSSYGASGTILTLAQTSSITSDNASYRIIPAYTSGRYWVTYVGSAAFNVALVTISAVAVNVSTATTALPGSYSTLSVADRSDMAVCGNKLVVMGYNAATQVSYNVITDTSGTASAGTAVTNNAVITANIFAKTCSNSTTASFAYYVATGTTTYYTTVDASGSSPVITYTKISNDGILVPTRRTFDSQIQAIIQQFETSSLYYAVGNSTSTRSSVCFSGGVNYPVLAYASLPFTTGANRTSGTNLYYVEYTQTPNMLNIVECATV